VFSAEDAVGVVDFIVEQLSTLSGAELERL